MAERPRHPAIIDDSVQHHEAVEALGLALEGLRRLKALTGADHVRVELSSPWDPDGEVSIKLHTAHVTTKVGRHQRVLDGREWSGVDPTAVADLMSAPDSCQCNRCGLSRCLEARSLEVPHG